MCVFVSVGRFGVAGATSALEGLTIGFRGGWSNVVNHLSRQTMKGALGPVMLNNCFILLMVGGSNLLVGALLQGQLIIRNGFNVLEINFRR